MNDTDGERRPRDGKGKWTATMDSAQRDAEAARLRARNWTHRRISEHLGYGGEGNVRRALKRMREEIVAPAVAELRTEMDAQLDQLAEAAHGVLEARHLKFDRGQVVTHGGEPVVDDAPILAAVETLLRVYGARRALFGLDAPSKTEVTGTTVRYVVEGADPTELHRDLT